MRNLLAITLAAAVLTVPLQAVEPVAFTGIHYLRPDGKKSKPVKARLVLHADAAEIRTAGKDALMKRLPYADMEAATYSLSKQPRWKTGAAWSLAIGVFALPIFFTKSKKHWLTVQGEDFAVLRLHKKNRDVVLAAFENRTGIQPDRITE